MPLTMRGRHSRLPPRYLLARHYQRAPTWGMLIVLHQDVSTLQSGISKAHTMGPPRWLSNPSQCYCVIWQPAWCSATSRCLCTCDSQLPWGLPSQRSYCCRLKDPVKGDFCINGVIMFSELAKHTQTNSILSDASVFLIYYQHIWHTSLQLATWVLDFEGNRGRSTQALWVKICSCRTAFGLLLQPKCPFR
jgi:hypothetical protein